MRTAGRRDEFHLFERLGINDINSIGFHIRYEKRFSIRGDPDVLRHTVRRPTCRHSWASELQVAHDFTLDQIDLGKPPAGKLTSEECEIAIDGKIGVIDAGTLRRSDVVLHRHGLRVTKFQAFQSLGDHNCRTSIRREVEIVGIRYFDRRARLAGFGIDRRQDSGTAPFCAACDPQRLQIP